MALSFIPDLSYTNQSINANKKEFFKYGTKKVPHRSHGTGDVFVGAFTAACPNN